MEDDFTFPLYEKAPSERRQQKGKKNEIVTNGRHGHYIRAIPANEDYSDIAVDATLRNAAVKQKDRTKPENGNVIMVKSEDIMKKVRIRRNNSLIVFLVDLSWSMAVTKRLNATKAAITTILTKAYQFRDDICLITFQKETATLVIPPTHSIALAEKAMKDIPVGGKTPLSAGLMLAHDVLLQETKNYRKGNIVLILLSDCDGNVSCGGDDPAAEALAAADKIALGGYHAIVINSDPMSFGEGHANTLAKHLNAACYLIDGINAEHLIKAVENELTL